MNSRVLKKLLFEWETLNGGKKNNNVRRFINYTIQGGGRKVFVEMDIDEVFEKFKEENKSQDSPPPFRDDEDPPPPYVDEDDDFSDVLPPPPLYEDDDDFSEEQDYDDDDFNDVLPS